MKFSHSILIFLLCGIAANATAECFYSPASNKPSRVVLRINSIISVPRDAPNGTILYESPPYQHSRSNDYYCSEQHPWGVKNNLGTDTPTTTEFPIGNTGISWQYIFSGNVRGGYGSYTEPKGSYTFENITTAIRLIKTGDIGGGVTIPAAEMGYIKVGELFPIAIILSNDVKIAASSCETPDIKVDMGEHDLEIFSKSGSHSKAVNFNIKLNNCPEGIKKITYSLAPTPTAPVWNANMGIIGLHASSTAKGIALQILDSSDQPMRINKNYTFNNFSSAGGNFVIPMAARYFRILPTGSSGEHDTGMSAGSANTDISFIMNYL